MTPTVRGAVEKHEQEPSNTEKLRRSLEQWRPVIINLLPSHITVERFVASVGNACRTVPDLLRCEQATVVGAALKAAQLGLEPNDNRNQCWILPYNVKGNDGVRRLQASFQVGYGGVIELCRRAAPGTHFDGRAVYPNDLFGVNFGHQPPLSHQPAVATGRSRGGDAYAWYVLVTWPDKYQTAQVLDREAVEYHRRFSKQPDGFMWTQSYDAAALKSVVLDMRRWLPQSPELADALAADDAVALPDVDADQLPAGANTAVVGPEPFAEIAGTAAEGSEAASDTEPSPSSPRRRPQPASGGAGDTGPDPSAKESSSSSQKPTSADPPA